MTLTRKALPPVAILALFAMVAAFGLAPIGARAADHLDAPGLMSPAGEARLDINDLYVFEGANPGNTVLALTVNPAAAGDADFATKKEGTYHIRIDQTGDAIEDVTYSIEFKDVDSGQSVKVRRATGKAARSKKPKGKVVGRGWTDSTFELKGNGTAFAGLRSDPFFFDLGGFLGTVEGSGGRMFNDGSESDFFDSLNTLAIVIEVPDWYVGSNVGVWATTSAKGKGKRWQVDRIGRRPSTPSSTAPDQSSALRSKPRTSTTLRSRRMTWRTSPLRWWTRCRPTHRSTPKVRTPTPTRACWPECCCPMC